MPSTDVKFKLLLSFHNTILLNTFAMSCSKPCSLQAEGWAMKVMWWEKSVWYGFKEMWVQILTSLLRIMALSELFTFSEPHFPYLKIGTNNVPQVGVIYRNRRVRIYESLAHRRSTLNTSPLLCCLRADQASTFTFATYTSYMILINCLNFLQPQFSHVWVIMYVVSHT